MWSYVSVSAAGADAGSEGVTEQEQDDIRSVVATDCWLFHTVFKYPSLFGESLFVIRVAISRWHCCDETESYKLETEFNN